MVSYKIAFKKIIVDFIFIILGALLISLGIVCFTLPNKIAAGGLTGMGTILYFVFSIPVGATVFLGNLILLIFQAKIIGIQSASKTIISISLMSGFIEIMQRVLQLPPLTNDPILACLYGGLLSGIGVGITFRGGGTTGGVDIVALLVNYLLNIPVGDVILISNITITVLASTVFGPQLALYGLLTVFFSSYVIDSVLEGMPIYRTVLIITKNPDEIAWGIMECLHRGVTHIDATGMYTNKRTNILLVAIRRMELSQLKRIIYEFDPDAFVIVGDARQVLGKGFKPLNEANDKI